MLFTPAAKEANPEAFAVLKELLVQTTTWKETPMFVYHGTGKVTDKSFACDLTKEQIKALKKISVKRNGYFKGRVEWIGKNTIHYVNWNLGATSPSWVAVYYEIEEYSCGVPPEQRYMFEHTYTK